MSGDPIDILVGLMRPTAQHPAMTIAIHALRRVATAEAHPSIILPAAENVACEAERAWRSDASRDTSEQACSLVYLLQVMVGEADRACGDDPRATVAAARAISHAATVALGGDPCPPRPPESMPRWVPLGLRTLDGDMGPDCRALATLCQAVRTPRRTGRWRDIVHAAAAAYPAAAAENPAQAQVVMEWLTSHYGAAKILGLPR